MCAQRHPQLPTLCCPPPSQTCLQQYQALSIIITPGFIPLRPITIHHRQRRPKPHLPLPAASPAYACLSSPPVTSTIACNCHALSATLLRKWPVGFVHIIRAAQAGGQSSKRALGPPHQHTAMHSLEGAAGPPKHGDIGSHRPWNKIARARRVSAPYKLSAADGNVCENLPQAAPARQQLAGNKRRTLQ
jgi:hypothetical protein